MREILWWLVGGVVTALVVGLSAAASARWLLRRWNVVHPQARTDAPDIWIVSPTTLARLHRRLRRAVSRTRALDLTGNEAIRARLEALHGDAVRLDAELVGARELASGLRRARTAVLASRVADLEGTAQRLTAATKRGLVVVAGGAGEAGSGPPIAATGTGSGPRDPAAPT